MKVAARSALAAASAATCHRSCNKKAKTRFVELERGQARAQRPANTSRCLDLLHKKLSWVSMAFCSIMKLPLHITDYIVDLLYAQFGLNAFVLTVLALELIGQA